MKVVSISDLHCGHRAGLTPPEWQLPIRGGTEGRNEWGKIQHELWNTYASIIEDVGPPIDLLLVNGDAIDGRGEASGGTELVVRNPLHQAEMAYYCLEPWEARNVVMSYGTAYHTGKLTDYEQALAKDLQGTIESHPFIEIEGITIDMKHKVGRSSIPHGRATPLAKERLWNTQWYIHEGQPLADIVLRSHLHYFSYYGEADWLAMILPPLQAAGTKYGARMCSNTIDWGLVEWDIDGGEYRWTPHLRKLAANRTNVIKIHS